MATVNSPGPASRVEAAPSDGFDDEPLRRPAGKTAWPGVPARSVLLALAGAGAWASAALDVVPFSVASLAAAVLAGAWFNGRQLARFLPLLSAVAVVGVFFAVPAGPTRSLLAVATALLTLGFGSLGRLALAAAVTAARSHEQARRDAELLRILDDARIFRLVGRAAENDDSGMRRELGQGLAVRDGLYRLLRLGERALTPDAIALYAADAAHKELTLIEQLFCVDGENRRRLPLGGRGIGTAGALGMSVSRRAPIRLLDVEGTSVRAHRADGPMPQSVLCVPLLERGSVRGVLVVDRLRPQLFTDDEEAFALALADELLAMMRTERVLEDLDNERKKVARVFDATRAFSGKVRVADTLDTAVLAVLDLVPRGAVVIAEMDGARAHLVRAKGTFGDLARLQGTDVDLDDETWLGRSLLRCEVLPHVGLPEAPHRGLIAADDTLVGGCGDLRCFPLRAHGVDLGGMIVAVASGERLSVPAKEALSAAADIIAMAWAGARAFDAVERQATTDGLTGLSNRRTLDRRLDEAIARARRMGTQLSLILTDVDHFKSVNDAWGHATGDEVLKGVARALLGAARTTDVVARYGGEEFCLVLEGTDAAGAASFAERMRVAIKGQQFSTAKGPLSVTSSFGVTELKEADDAHALLERSDQQLYRAKQQGRDRVVIG